MKRLFIFSCLSVVLTAGCASSKGRRSEQKGFGWDDSRIRRGSPANPNSSFSPPQFESYSPVERREDSDRPTNSASAPPQKKSNKKEEAPVEETWTIEGEAAVQRRNAAKGTAETPAQKPVPPPSTTLESGEQALPENDVPEKPAETPPVKH